MKTTDRKKTLDEVVEVIAKRSAMLIKMSKVADEDDDEEFAQQLSMRAWELEMVLQDIERNLRS